MLFEVFLKVLMMITMIFGENNVLGPKYIDIMNFGGWQRGWGEEYVVFLNFLFIVHKNKKVEGPILKSNSTSF